jgi:hypothetical protein
MCQALEGIWEIGGGGSLKTKRHSTYKKQPDFEVILFKSNPECSRKASEDRGFT